MCKIKVLSSIIAFFALNIVWKKYIIYESFISINGKAYYKNIRIRDHLSCMRKNHSHFVKFSQDKYSIRSRKIHLWLRHIFKHSWLKLGNPYSKSWPNLMYRETKYYGSTKLWYDLILDTFGLMWNLHY